MSLICQKCLSSRTGDVLGANCRTAGCDGVLEEEPAFSTLVDELLEGYLCPRRIEVQDRIGTPAHDHWLKFKAAHGNRVCSFCGSLHPDDFLALVKASAEAQADASYETSVQIEPSDKSYKLYVHQPGVRNAHEGGIKFYTMHLPRNADKTFAITDVQHKEYVLAVKRSTARFMAWMRCRGI